MKNLLCIILVIFVGYVGYGQGIEELFEADKFDEILKFESKGDSLTGRELYLIGRAHQVKGNYEKAITFFDRARTSGLDSAYVYYNQGLCFGGLDLDKAAAKSLEIAVSKSPENQQYIADLAIILISNGEIEKGIKLAKEAREYPFRDSRVFLVVGYMSLSARDFAQAKEDFEYGLKKTPEGDETRTEFYLYLGLAEYHLQNYGAAVKRFNTYLDSNPYNYGEYYRLIKAYNANKEYAEADKLFGVLLEAYNRGEIDKSDKHNRRVCVAEYVLDTQLVVIYKYLDVPSQAGGVYYKIIIFDKAAEQVQRTFLLELMSNWGQKKKGNNYVFCESGEGWHATYTRGWNEADLNLPSLMKTISDALADKIQPAAQSGFRK